MFYIKRIGNFETNENSNYLTLIFYVSVSIIIYKEVHKKLTTAVSKESRIINRVLDFRLTARA